jgi:hypothetical protein
MVQFMIQAKPRVTLGIPLTGRLVPPTPSPTVPDHDGNLKFLDTVKAPNR